jgi:hypothetical protein
VKAVVVIMIHFKASNGNQAIGGILCPRVVLVIQSAASVA